MSNTPKQSNTDGSPSLAGDAGSDYTGWNFEWDANGIYACKKDHPKEMACSYEPLTNHEVVTIVRALSSETLKWRAWAKTSPNVPRQP